MFLKQEIHRLPFTSLFPKPLFTFYQTQFDGRRFPERHSVPAAVMGVSVTDKCPPPARPGVVPSMQQQDKRLHQTAVNQFALKVTDEAGDANIFHFLCLLRCSLANIWLA